MVTSYAATFRTVLYILLIFAGPCHAATSLDLQAFRLTTDGSHGAQLAFDNGKAWHTSHSAPMVYLKSGESVIVPEAITSHDNTFAARFNDGSTLRFKVSRGEGFALYHLEEADLKSSASQIGLFNLPVPDNAKTAGTLNAAFFEDQAVAVMAAVPDVHAFVKHNHFSAVDKPGCTHTFVQTTQSITNTHGARFTATSNAAAGGWSMRGLSRPSPVDISAFVGIKVKVHGDGKGQQLKIQYVDSDGGARDYYIPMNFTGWKDVELTTPSLDTIGSRMTGLNIYYNGLPPESTVECIIDEIAAVVQGDDGSTSARVLEDFDGSHNAWWQPAKTLVAEAEQGNGLEGLSFGVIACPQQDFFQVVEHFEKAAGIKVTYPEGVWNKQSPAIKDSYLFLTSFKESQFEEAVALARRGGFNRVLLEQSSWCTGTGHYNINRASFPDGIDGLARLVRRFREAGIETGLHLLAASIYPPDPYLTPVPDDRLIKRARATVAFPLDADTTTILVNEKPDLFPAEDGGYNGNGTVLQVGTELITYESRSTTAPFTFYGCKRGHLGTRAQEHRAGTEVRHLLREYGYHLYDLDSSLLDEVASNFAKVANAADISMVYFDGAERLQGEHWRYNARLIKAFTDRIDRKDMLYQASSYSHYSWHLLCRTASADGHGDLKAYLEQRSPAFADFALNGIPLDIGWYYGYDKDATPDMYEYILGTTIGYDSSMSYQASVAAAAAHPFTNEILDLIKRYERLRLSNRVPQHVRELLRVHPKLQGLAPEATDRPNELRRDYRLIEEDNKELFQRVVYAPWQKIDTTATSTTFDITVTTCPADLGFQLHVTSGSTTPTETAVSLKVNSRQMGWKGELGKGQYLFAWPGESIQKFGPNAGQTTFSSVLTPEITLPAGSHRVEFQIEKAKETTIRVRTTLQLPERHVIP